MDSDEISARIRAARGYAGFSQPGLAKVLELSVQTVKRMESGERPVRPMELRHIADVCRVPREFMEGGWSAITAIHHGSNNLSERMQSLSVELHERMERLEKELSEAPGLWGLFWRVGVSPFGLKAISACTVVRACTEFPSA